MSQPDFAALLQFEVAPVLAPAGYGYEPRLRLDDELFGFRKALAGSVQTIVQFQRRLTTGAFTVNLLRVTAEQIHPRVYAGYTQAGGARLSTVLWYVDGLRDYPASDWWWQSDVSALRDVADKIVRYGVRWLEDVTAPKPWEMPAPRSQELTQAAQEVLAPALSAWGFQWKYLRLAGAVPYLYAVKALTAGTVAMIELQPTYSLDPAEFTFDVRLQLAKTPDALDAADVCASLAQLRWQDRYAAASVPHGQGGLTPDEAKALLWRYADQVELDAQLRDVASCLQRFGLAWFDRHAGEA